MRREELERKIKDFEIDIDDYEEQYQDLLNEEGPVKVCGLCFDPASILKELDFTAYRCGLIDYCDSIEKEDDPKYRELLDELKNIEEEEKNEE